MDERAGRLAAMARVDAAGAEIRSAFAAAGIDCIVLKGRGFAHRLYDQIWERPYSDTDLLVRPADRAAAERILGDRGYTRVDRDEDRLGAPGYAHTFARADGALIDLHWSLSGATAPFERIWAALSTRTVELKVGGQPARVLNDEATALVVTLHNAHHGARGTRTVPDLDRAVERLSFADWVGARRLAEQLGAREAFTAGLRLTPTGNAVADRLQLETPIHLEYRLRAEPTSYAAWAVHRVRSAAGPRERWDAFIHVVVPPPTVMRLFFPLARRGRRGLIAAYALRPIRLLIGVGPAIAEYVRAHRP